ncbi:2'-5' RNA ligase family protein [Oleomonas cavernae]|uniref:2'-5' RNA ligase family protein n=1 Tax=Oleomonas cavernae TaxID=2320859 RepID=UPI001F26DC67|nr:2'-5' RNA ligase family protein [Oleomonas cavernae]
MIRLFVALPLPQSVRNLLSFVGGGIPGARWTLPENFHITLKFIGNVDERVADDIVTASTGSMPRPSRSRSAASAPSTTGAGRACSMPPSNPARR